MDRSMSESAAGPSEAGVILLTLRKSAVHPAWPIGEKSQLTDLVELPVTDVASELAARGLIAGRRGLDTQSHKAFLVSLRRFFYAVLRGMGARATEGYVTTGLRS